MPQRTETQSSLVVTPGAGGAVQAVAVLTPAYDGDPAVVAWQRAIDFQPGCLRVTDSFTLGADTQAIFQVNTPVRPVISGQTAQAGDLSVRVLSPAGASLSALDWTTQSGPDETYYRGWRLDVSGGSSGYLVELCTGYTVFSDGFEDS